MVERVRLNRERPVVHGLRRARRAGLLTINLAGIAAANGRAQEATIPEKGEVTLVGCFLREKGAALTILAKPCGDRRMFRPSVSVRHSDTTYHAAFRRLDSSALASSHTELETRVTRGGPAQTSGCLGLS